MGSFPFALNPFDLMDFFAKAFFQIFSFAKRRGFWGRLFPSAYTLISQRILLDTEIPAKEHPLILEKKKSECSILESAKFVLSEKTLLSSESSQEPTDRSDEVIFEFFMDKFSILDEFIFEFFISQLTIVAPQTVVFFNVESFNIIESFPVNYRRLKSSASLGR